jgi:hypothetical protein
MAIICIYVDKDGYMYTPGTEQPQYLAVGGESEVESGTTVFATWGKTAAQPLIVKLDGVDADVTTATDCKGRVYFRATTNSRQHPMPPALKKLLGL